MRPSAERRAALAALAAAHDAWVLEHLDGARFDLARAVERSPSDYNLHYLDLHAPPEVGEALWEQGRQIMGG